MMQQERTGQQTAARYAIPRRAPSEYPPSRSPLSKAKVAQRIRTFIDAFGGPDSFALLVCWPPEQAHTFYDAPIENYRHIRSLVASFGCDELYFLTGLDRKTVEELYAECARRDPIIQKHNVTFDQWLLVHILHEDGIDTVEDLLRYLLGLPRCADKRRQHDLATLIDRIIAA